MYITTFYSFIRPSCSTRDLTSSRSPSLAPLPNIAPHVIITPLCLLIQRLLCLRSTLSFKIFCFCWTIGCQHLHPPSQNDPATYRAFPCLPPASMTKSPPSSKGISRLSPAPEAAEPTLTVDPGNLLVTFVSTPDSFAEG